MPIISKVTLPDNTTYDITDGRGMFVGSCSTSAATQTKDVSISADQNFVLRIGAVIAVKFTYSNTYKSTTSAPCKLNVNGTGAKNIYWVNTATPNNTTSTIAFGTANYYHFYLYDGSNWVWVGYSNESNTTYSGMTAAEIEAGTSATNRLISPANLKTAIELWSDKTMQNGCLKQLIDTGSKNLLQLTGTDVTGYGVACTFDHAAGTIHLDGINSDKKCTGSFNIQISPTINAPFVAGTVYRFVCDGYATSDDTIGSYVYTSGATPLTQFDCFTNNVASWNDAWKQNSGFRLFIRSGTVVNNVTLKPMICTEDDWSVSQKVVPYCPTLSELYALIKSYHP